MSLQQDLKNDVGVRELHDHLSRYVGRVAHAGEVIVTMRGKPASHLVYPEGRAARGRVLRWEDRRSGLRRPIADREWRVVAQNPADVGGPH